METKQEVSHTPTPWKVSKNHSLDWIVSDGERIAVCDETIKRGTSGEANAAFITKAVNNFESMLEALKCLVSDIETSGNKVSPYVKDIILRAEIK